MNPLQVGTSLMAPTQSETWLPVPVRVVPNNGRLGRDTLMLTGSAAQSDSDTETSTPSRDKAVVDRNFGTLQRVEKPTCKEIQYDTYEGRLESFYDWPSDSPMRPEDLARAGFFYTHTVDKVKCPYCFGGIYNWEATDDAIGEHVRHNPRCAYLKYLMYSYLTSPVPTIQHGGASKQLTLENPQADGGASKQLALEYPQADGEKSKEVAMKAVQNLGYPYKLIQQVLQFLHQREEFSTDSILDKIFDEESKVGHSLISREPGEPGQDSKGDSKKSKELAMKAVQNLGYPLKLIQQVLQCHHHREDISTDSILHKIFDEESKVGHSLISREPGEPGQDSKGDSKKSKELAMKAVQNLGYPLKLIQQVLQCHHHREDISTDSILHKIFDEESKVGHSLISREPEPERPGETLDQAVGNLDLNVSNVNHNENESRPCISNKGNEGSNSVEDELYNSSEEVTNTMGMEEETSRTFLRWTRPYQPSTSAGLDLEYGIESSLSISSEDSETNKVQNILSSVSISHYQEK